MVRSVTFKTRARTVDHLGREQIADGPTAVSELWKNAYDAYARKVTLHIFNGACPVAAIVDDGHGMSREEFEERWLIVGTESKIIKTALSNSDRNGLPLRERQGQKGIGRLSSASLGPLLLLISKRKGHPFVSTLVDWRLFENPYLLLQDVQIPIAEFDEPDQFHKQLHAMSDTLIGNAWGDLKDKDRARRLKTAWNDFDVLEQSQNIPSTRKAVEMLVTEMEFTDTHLATWPVWNGESETGTALLIGDINFDLRSQLLSDAQAEVDEAVTQARSGLISTLSHFTDPYSNSEEANEGYAADDFSYSVQVWNGGEPRTIVNNKLEYGEDEFDQLEHIIDGKVDRNGVFRGRVKAFGEWMEGIVTIRPSAQVPKGATTRVGPFLLRMGTYEQVSTNSSLDKAIHARLSALVKNYSGLMVYRDGLRVLPFGRTDNDFFQIEYRRTLHAGREFWVARRIFGRIATKRSENPNLKDKAGREGLIDNQAAKTFRDIVTGILKTSARHYFGTDSDDRREKVGDIRRQHRDEKAIEARKKFVHERREAFGRRLVNNIPEVMVILSELEAVEATLADDATVNNSDTALALHSAVMNARGDLALASTGDPPAELGRFEEPYKEYLDARNRVKALDDKIGAKLILSLDSLEIETKLEAVRRSINFRETNIIQRVRKWTNEITNTLGEEIQRIQEISEQRSEGLRHIVQHLLDDIKADRISLDRVLQEIDLSHAKLDEQNVEFYEPYKLAIDALQQSIDISTIATFGMAQVSALREELDRLNELAQLGITIEIIGHEMEDLDSQIHRGLKALPADIQNSDVFLRVQNAHEQLTDKLRFLSPMKLSGDRPREEITGDDLYQYCSNFFDELLGDAEIEISGTPDFLAFKIFEQRARLYPVFVNLVNNS